MRLASLFREYWAAWALHPRERGKLVLGFLLFPKVTYEWLSYLRNHDLLKPLVLEYPKLATRIYRPYALRSLGCRHRAALIMQHHNILRSAGWSELTSVSARSPLPLISWRSPEGGQLLLQLVSLIEAHREGELHFQLLWEGNKLMSLTFLVRERAGHMELLVTRLQGVFSTEAAEWIRSATKTLHGLRPADLLIQVAQQAAQTLGCHRVLLVSNRQRVALNPMRRARIRADLDRLWNQRGAQLNSEGLYQLDPFVSLRSDYSDLESSKRAKAKRRTAVLQQTIETVDHCLRMLRLDTTGVSHHH